jgi:hypothetical protein
MFPILSISEKKIKYETKKIVEEYDDGNLNLIPRKAWRSATRFFGGSKSGQQHQLDEEPLQGD